MIIVYTSPTDRPGARRGPDPDPGRSDRPTRSEPAGGEIVGPGRADRPTLPEARRVGLIPVFGGDKLLKPL